MATARPPSASALVVHQLVELFRSNGHRILHERNKVCLTSDSLTLLNNYFQAANLDFPLPISADRPRTNSLPPLPALPSVQHLRISTKLREDLIFLHDFIQKIQAVKLIHNIGTLQGNVLLYPFQHVVCLELKKIPPHMVLGLSLLRPQLETLICSQSVTKLEDLIGDCGGDSVRCEPWPRLKSLFLAHNFIERIDQSLRYLVALEVLDLSHNRLQDCSNILEVIPHVKHLNLSSNQLRAVPIWLEERGPCRLLTLKMRQNSLEDVIGIEKLNSIVTLDLSDNFITLIPEQLRYLPVIERLAFARNPFTYASNYRQDIVANLPYVFAQETRQLSIDEQALTSKEKQRIPMRRPRPQNVVSAFPLYSPSPSTQNTTTSESTTEPESIATNSSGTVVARHSRSRRKPRDGNLRLPDANETPTEHITSGSETESATQRRRLVRGTDSRQDGDGLNQAYAVHPYQTTGLDQNETSPKASASIASSIPRKLVNDLSQSPKRRKSPRSRKLDQPSKIVLEVVDVCHSTSEDTPVPDSPSSPKNLDSHLNHHTPIPTLDPRDQHLHDEHTTGDSLRTIFFVTNHSSGDHANYRSLTIELDPMYLIEKDNDNEDYLKKLKYSTIKLLTNVNSPEKTVELTFEKRRNEVERRIYSFDTKQDQKAFVEEIERYLESSAPVEIAPISPIFLQCSKCGKNFPPLSTVNKTSNTSTPVCLDCQNTSPPPAPTEFTSPVPLVATIGISSDQSDLDHHLHFTVATEHFTHDNEQIKLHFRCFVVRSTTSKYFVAQTILTDYGIYIFQCEPANETGEIEYTLVGKDLLTNVLMLDIGYRQQTFTIELQSAAFAFLLADQQKTQTIINNVLEVLSPVVQSGEGALQKISRISSDEYRQRLFDIIKVECAIDEPNDDMIDFYSIMIRMDQAGNSQMIALLLLRNWILMIEDAYATIDSRHVRLPAPPGSEANANFQLKCDLMHLVNVTNYTNHAQLFVFDFVDESETKQFRWRLESLTTDSKDEFLSKVRDTYQTLMAIPMPEKLEPLL